MRAEALAALERDARSRQVQGLLDAAARMEANGDPAFAEELRAEAGALAGRRGVSGRVVNCETLIRREIDKAARRGQA